MVFQAERGWCTCTSPRSGWCGSEVVVAMFCCLEWCSVHHLHQWVMHAKGACSLRDNSQALVIKVWFLGVQQGHRWSSAFWGQSDGTVLFTYHHTHLKNKINEWCLFPGSHITVLKAVGPSQELNWQVHWLDKFIGIAYFHLICIYWGQLLNLQFGGSYCYVVLSIWIYKNNLLNQKGFFKLQKKSWKQQQTCKTIVNRTPFWISYLNLHAKTNLMWWKRMTGNMVLLPKYLSLDQQYIHL